MDVFAQFDLQKIALLLDVDGTIVDIGPSPAEVHVGAGLLETLKRLFALMDGALALVSGRPIGDLDRLFAPLRLPTIGGHGAEMRLRDNEVFFWAKPLPHDLRKRLAESTGIGSGVVVEDKDYSRAALSEISRAGRQPAPARRGEPGGISWRADRITAGQGDVRGEASRRQQRRERSPADGAFALRRANAHIHWR